MRVILAGIAIAIFAMVALLGFNAALADNLDTYTNTNESFTPDAGNVTELEDSNLQAADYNDTVTVYNASNVTMTDGADYEWFDENGTLKTLAGGDLANDTTGYITYSYQRPPADQVMLSNILAQIPRAMGFALPLFAVLFLLALLRGG